MKIVSWNCFRGPRAARAAALGSFSPDIVVLQECSNVEPAPARSLGFGTNQNHGVGVVASAPYALREIPAAIAHSVFACTVTGPLEFNLLAVWAHPKPTYVDAVWNGLDAYASFLASAGRATLMIGDFNSHPQLDKPGNRTHRMLEERLLEEFGLVSAWHAFRPSTPEPSTLYFRWKEAQGFHIDYCFVPQAWVRLIKDVSVAEFSGLDWRSDHRPLIVEIDVPQNGTVM